MGSREALVLLARVLFVVFLMNHECVESAIIQGPADTTASVNESTYFNCSTSIRPIDKKSVIWVHFPLDAGGDRKYVYDDGKVMNGYENRFYIDIDLSSGKFNLIFLRLELRDAGRYKCIYDAQEDIGASAELTVVDSDLDCDSDMNPKGIVGPTQCEKTIAPDDVKLSCRVTYNGKNAPEMVWRRAGDVSPSNNTDCVTTGNHMTCNTTLTASLLMSGSVYTCELATQQYKCSLRINNILYAFANYSTKGGYYTGQDVTCKANASRQLACSYRWYKDTTTEVSSHPTFTPTDPGLYICKAQCPIRADADSCIFTAMMINVNTFPLTTTMSNVTTVPLTSTMINVTTVPIQGPQSQNWVWWLSGSLIIIVCVCAVAAAAALICYLWKRYYKPKPRSLEEEIPLLEQIDIEMIFNAAPSERRTLSGDMRWPKSCIVEGKERECAFERIFCKNNPHTMDGEISEEKETVSSNARKWKELKHINLIEFYDVIERTSAVYVVMEYAAGGTVREATFDSERSRLSDSEVMAWATQIAQGMKYLLDNDTETNKIIHGNIQSTQIFILGNTLKIGSFNLLQNICRDSASAKEPYSGYSPEAHDEGDYSKQSQVWSYGVIVWEILTKQIPYEGFRAVGKIVADLKENAKMLEIPNECPNQLKIILKGCLKSKKDERLTFDGILSKLEYTTLAATSTDVGFVLTDGDPLC